MSEGSAGPGAEGRSTENGRPGTEDGVEAEGSGCLSSKPGHGAGPVIPLPSIPALSFPSPPPCFGAGRSHPFLPAALQCRGMLRDQSPPTSLSRAPQIWSFAALAGLRLLLGLVLFLLHPFLWPPSESFPRYSLVNFSHPPSLPSGGFRGPEF